MDQLILLKNEKRKQYDRKNYYKNRDKYLITKREYRIKNIESIRQKAKEYREKNREKINKKIRDSKKTPQGKLVALKSQLKCSYGLSLEWYFEKLKEQNNGCGICGSSDPGHKSKRWLCVDHDHKNGKIRGLLCNLCNTRLGAVESRNRIDLLSDAENKYLLVYKVIDPFAGVTA